METSLRILNVEDSERDSELLKRHVKAAGYEVACERVETAEAMKAALAREKWDLILCDYSMPRFSALAALAVLQAADIDVPFIIISGTVGEEIAVQALLTGANDYIPKGNLTRLIPAIDRELKEAQNRRERKTTEDALRLSEGRYRGLFECAPDGIIVASPDSYYLDANPGMCKMLGYQHRELIGMHATDIVAASESKDLDAALAEVMTATEYSEEWCFKRKDGSTFAGEVIARIMPDGNLLAMVRDVTERNEAEEKLRFSEAQLNQAQGLTHMGSWSWNLVDNSLFWSDEHFRIYGLVPGEVEPSYDIVLGSAVRGGRDLLVSKVDKSLRTLEPFQAYFSILRPDGVERMLDSRGSVDADARGKPIRMYGTIQDVTERMQAENERRVISEIIQGGVTTPNLDEYLKLVHRSISQVVYAENCFVMLHDPVTGMNHFEFWVDQQDPIPPPHLSGKGFSSYVLRTGNALLCTDETKAQLQELGEAEMIGSSSPSWVGVPLRTPTHTIGVLALQHYEKKDAFSQGDLEFLSSVGDQIALAIERKRAEEALKESEEKYREMVENAIDIMYTLDREGNYTSVNKAGERITGYLRQETLTRNISLTVAPDYQARAAHYHTEQLAGRDVGSFELEVIAKDGRRLALEVNTKAIMENGVPVGVQGIARDITERKRLESARLASELKYQKLFTLAPLGIYQSLPDGSLTTVNAALARMLGYDSPEELLTRNFADIYFDSKDRRELLEQYEEQGFVTDIDLRWKRKDGSPVWIQLTAQAIKGVDGKTEHFEGFVRDITESKRNEAALRSSEERYRELVENALDIIYTHDLQGNYTSANKAAESITGYTNAEILALNMADTIPADQVEKAKEMIAAKLAGDQITAYELELLAKDGHGIPVEVNTRIVYEDGVPVGVQGIARDVTERNRASAALLESETRLRTIIETSPECVKLLSSEGLLLVMNPAGLRMIEADSFDKVANQSVFGLIDREHRQAFRDVIDSVFRGEPGTLEFQITGFKGGRRWLETHASPLLDGAGNITALLGITRDVTERRRAEKEIELTLQRLHNAQRMGQIGDWEWDLATEAVTWSPEVFSITGRDPLLGPPADYAEVNRSYDPASRKVMDETVAAAIETGLAQEYELELVRPDGERVYIHAMCEPKKNSDGDIVALNGTIQDISARKLAEDRVTKSEANLAKSQEIAHLGSWEMDLARNGNVQEGDLRWSDEVFRIFGYEPGEIEVSYERFFEAVHADDRASITAAIAHALRNKTVYRLDHRVVRPDGTERFVHEHAEIILDEAGDALMMVGTVQDITDRKQLEEQFRQSQKMEAVGVLAGGIAHDFNNLLTAINGYSDLTLRKMAADDPLRRNIVEVKEAGTRAAELTGQLLAFSRKQVLRSVVLNINTVVSNIEKMLRRIIKESVELRVALGPDLGNVRADPSQIEQVVMNLAINARDAMPNGGTLTIETENVHLDKDYVAQHINVAPGDFIRMTVTDTGHGMDARTQSHIFEPFFTTKEVGKGTGLGLSTVYGIVKQSGGDVMVYSEPDHGTTFKIYLPCVDEKVQRSRWTGERAQTYSGTETILLVEDEDVVRNLVCEILTGNGYKVLEAPSGKAALHICETYTETIHMLLTDVIMPKMGGSELKHHVVELLPDIKVLYMSGYTDDSVAHRGIFDTNTEFIEKPFTPDALARKVREVLEY